MIEETNISRSVEGMNQSDFKKIAKAAAAEVKDTYSVPRYFTQAEIIEILNKIKDLSESLSK